MNSKTVCLPKAQARQAYANQQSNRDFALLLTAPTIAVAAPIVVASAPAMASGTFSGFLTIWGVASGLTMAPGAAVTDNWNGAPAIAINALTGTGRNGEMGVGDATNLAAGAASLPALVKTGWQVLRGETSNRAASRVSGAGALDLI